MTFPWERDRDWVKVNYGAEYVGQSKVISLESHHTNTNRQTQQTDRTARTTKVIG